MSIFSIFHERDNDGEIIRTTESWKLPSGHLHREDGSAYSIYTIVNGRRILTLESWYWGGKFHRDNAPAFQEWQVVNDEAVLTSEYWFWRGRFHREDGPSIQKMVSSQW